MSKSSFLPSFRRNILIEVKNFDGQAVAFMAFNIPVGDDRRGSIDSQRSQINYKTAILPCISVQMALCVVKD